MIDYVTICGIGTVLPQEDFDARIAVLGTVQLTDACEVLAQAVRRRECIRDHHPALVAVAEALTLPGGESPVLLLPGAFSCQLRPGDVARFFEERGVTVRKVGGGR